MLCKKKAWLSHTGELGERELEQWEEEVAGNMNLFTKKMFY